MTMMRRRLHPGLVQVYTGPGKGKTTAAVGQAVRALSQKLRVCMVRFLKGDRRSGEVVFADRLGDDLTLAIFGTDRQARGGAWWGESFTDEDREQAQAGLQYAAQAISSGEHDVVILDEINCAVDAGLIAPTQVLDLIEAKPEHVELILTGRGAPQAIIDRADLVTEMGEVKHPYQRGISARRGIEF